MKKIIPLSLGFLALGIGTLSGFKHTHFEIASAYSASSLTKTINLNDSTIEEIRNYYSNLNSLADSEKTGTNLLKNLKPILRNGQKYFSYESKTAIWQMYEIIDRDWEKSPASALTSEYGQYDPETNTIKNYLYGTSNSKKGSDPYLHALYINREVENKTKAWGDHNQNQWGINQEHIWPKSHGFDQDGAGGARGDPMHLWAANGYVNNIHNNNFYGFVDTTKSYTDCGNKYSNQTGNLSGTSKTLGTGTVFEPQDCDKGDIARSVFYMVARYNYYSGSDPDGIDSNNPNLFISDEIDMSVGTSTSSKAYNLGILSDLLEWNRMDPVDEFEIHRNNLLFNNYTNNRNPFIDFPQWADLIWGDEAGSKPANPQTDSVNDSAIVLKDFNPNITEGQDMKFSATVEGGAQITWEIEDESIATIEKYTAPVSAKYQVKAKSTVTVDSGVEVVIKPVKTGKTKLTAKTIVGGDPYEKTYSIKVVSKSEQKDQGSILDTILKNPLYLGIAIGVIVLVIIIVIIFIAVGTKKQKKIVKKTIKKTVKKTNSGSKGKKK